MQINSSLAGSRIVLPPARPQLNPNPPGVRPVSLPLTRAHLKLRRHAAQGQALETLTWLALGAASFAAIVLAAI